nr:N-acetyltransferase [Sulfitobacter brevis]
MSKEDIRREVTGSKGRYVLTREDHAAELTYSQLGPTQVIADHTEVPEALAGTGAGGTVGRRCPRRRLCDCAALPLR